MLLATPAQPQKFEAYALETCLHVPAGLLADQVRQSCTSSCTCSYNGNGMPVLQAAPVPTAHPAL